MSHRVRPLAPNRPTVAEVEPLVVAWMVTPADACLHCQLDDGNVEDRFFGDEDRPAHERCRVLFDLLRAMSVTQRKKVIDRARQKATHG